METTEEQERNKIVKTVRNTVSHLREITGVDTIQIFVTKESDHGSSDTMSFEFGLGNYYARQGQIQEWLTIQTQYQIEEAKRRDKKY